MQAMRVTALRLLYRLAYRGLRGAAIFSSREGNGVKCLLTNSGQVLLVKHTYGRREVWYLPGGNIRRGERAERAAAREMREELGLSDIELRQLATVSLMLGRTRVRLTCLHAELEQRRLQLDPVEIDRAEWFAPQALPARLGPEVRRFIDLLEGQPQA